MHFIKTSFNIRSSSESTNKVERQVRRREGRSGEFGADVQSFPQVVFSSQNNRSPLKENKCILMDCQWVLIFFNIFNCV